VDNMTKCSALPSLVVYPLEVIFIAADDRQGDYLRDFVAVGRFDQVNDFGKKRGFGLDDEKAFPG